MMFANLLACIWLGFSSTMVNGDVKPTTTSAPSVVELLVQEFRAMNQKLDSIHQVMQSSYSAGGSKSELRRVTKKLLTLDTKFQAAQTKLEITEKKLEAKLEGAEITLKANLTAVETTLKANLKAVETRLEAVETQLVTTDTALKSTHILFESKWQSGSTFVRWGRKTCTNGTQLVYTGVAGGSAYSHAGAAVDMLCLTMAPQFDGTPPTSGTAYLFGTEYQEFPTHHDHDVPCSVCRAVQSTTIMVPATHACPVGWTTQYTGRLVAGHHGHPAATQYNCLDGNPEHLTKGHENKDGRLLYNVVTVCGSLPCPPYTNAKLVSCVVCSK